ncbi:F0F1 ATP synthase subunit A [Parasporobacterium paucivorans]|uniref:ATP synthase subunit a n=1 Tax=Parasporobacterium paucivorans DSM 15970 TaxID=1122934 RepID=A0A1M6FLB1_9FIRM|nr:F-type H+-transporting ATPase subunit a [Parasporobacterium paucivorans DSM 15970]
MSFAERLVEELQNKVSFTIPVFGGIPVPESVMNTWIIMAILLVASVCLTKNLKVQPTSKIQLTLEVVIGFLFDFFEGMLGEKGKRYVPWLSSVMIFVVCANISGLFGMVPPTKDLNVTAALAVMSIVLIIYAGIKGKKFKGYAKSFLEPMPFMLPINLLEIVIRPLTLCMRLFGNMFGGFTVMELVKLLIPVIIPIPLSVYFDIFDGLIQAYVFCLLTSLYIHEAME